MQKINSTVVLATYKYLLDVNGKSSCGSTAEELERRGYVSPKGKPISRMAVWRMLMSTLDGRAAVESTKQRVGK